MLYAKERQKPFWAIFNTRLQALHAAITTHIENEVESQSKVASVSAPFSQRVNNKATPLLTNTYQYVHERYRIKSAEDVFALEKTLYDERVVGPLKMIRYVVHLQFCIIGGASGVFDLVGLS